MGRTPCCDKASVKKGPWSPEEDAKLKDFLSKHGTCSNWITLPHKAGLKRCGKSCRLRWLNYLRPNIKHGEFSDEEDRIICSLYASIGSRWSIIAAQLPGRTDNDIKNYWNTKLKKKLLAMLPPLQKKPSFFPSLPLESPHNHHHQQQSHQFITFPSSFHSYTPNNFTNVNNITKPLTTTLVHDHISPDLSPPPPPSNPMMARVNENCYNLGFQDDHESMYNNYYPPESCGMLMFGGGTTEASTTGSSEGGSCMSQISYHKDHSQIQVKQEDEIALEGLGDQRYPHGYIDQKPKGYIKNHVPSPILQSNNVNISSYLFNDGGNENKTTHYDENGMCHYY